ncbi:MAG: M13 family metallopeptidase [Candidatus Accumulibacter propinquus]|jgi:putative endopeptidase
MKPTRFSQYLAAALCAATSFAVAPVFGADPARPVASNSPPNVYNNFGFPMGFDVSKMDKSANPRQDFRRYTAGKWLDTATIPGDVANLDGIKLVKKQVEPQVAAVLVDAAAAAPTARKGTPVQQVGDFYTAGMHIDRLKALGVKPLQPVWERIAKVDGSKALAEEMARLSLFTNQPVVFGFTVTLGITDPTKYVVAVSDADLALPAAEDYLAPDLTKVREAYVRMITDSLVLAGVPPDQAKARAAKVLEMETRIACKKLTPEQARDFSAAYKTLPYAEVKAMLGNLDLDAYFKVLGLPTGGTVQVTEAAALKERNALLAEYALEDTKAYLQWEVLRRTSPYLTPALAEVQAPLDRALTGQAEAPKREQVVAKAVTRNLGHDLGQLYVARYFSAKSRADAEALLNNVRAEFRQRLEQNTWLTAPTRDYVLKKIDKMKIVVGYPDKWIDYSSVDVAPDDYFGDVVRLNDFAARRSLARLGQPPAPDAFSDPENSVPTAVNAGYSPDMNGVEIPAAILQPPFYDPKADAGVNYCTLGAVIGHELTHSLDWMGRTFDANGALRDWWTPADVAAFDQRSKNLIRQADAYEVLPGVHLNGKLSAGENLADIGGLMLGYRALQTHLKANPQDKRRIDGFTPQQRCFLAWSQMWAEKVQPELLRVWAATEPHPPGAYRMVAPASNHPGFYDAFGIRAGDRMWVAPKDRVSMW